MAKPLLTRTDRSPVRKMALSEGGGLPVVVTIITQQLVHVVPEGYKDEIHLWWNNNDASVAGAILIEINADANLSLIRSAAARSIEKVLDGMVIEAGSADVDVDALALTEPGVLWGYVFRSAIGDS